MTAAKGGDGSDASRAEGFALPAFSYHLRYGITSFPIAGTVIRARQLLRLRSVRTAARLLVNAICFGNAYRDSTPMPTVRPSHERKSSFTAASAAGRWIRMNQVVLSKAPRCAKGGALSRILRMSMNRDCQRIVRALRVYVAGQIGLWVCSSC